MKTRIVRLLARACAAVVGLILLATAAHADPIQITSGGWTFATFEDGGDMQLVSDRFGVGAPWDCCAFAPFFPAGSTMNLTTTTVAQHSIFGGGTVDGVTYGSGNYLSFGGTTMTFSSPNIILPPGWAFPAGQTVTIHQPFSMTGELTLAQWMSGASVLSSSIAGAGELKLTLTSVVGPDGPGWSTGAPVIDSVDFVFGSTSASPTPEPASMLLFGSGLAGVVLRRFRRSSRRELNRQDQP